MSPTVTDHTYTGQEPVSEMAVAAAIPELTDATMA